MVDQYNQHDDDSPVWGAAAIGKLIGRNPRQCFYLLERGIIPAKKVGNLWVTSKRMALSAVLPAIDTRSDASWPTKSNRRQARSKAAAK